MFPLLLLAFAFDLESKPASRLAIITGTIAVVITSPIWIPCIAFYKIGEWLTSPPN
jgi:hypothetical protein